VAEMKIPGRLWLQFEVDPGEHDSLVRQTTVFDPAGFVGLAYWYLLYPVHHRVFGAMMRGIRNAMEPESSVVHLLPRREIEEVSEAGAARSVQEAEVLVPYRQLERLWRSESLEWLGRSYWRFLARVCLGLIRVVYRLDSPSIVLLSRRFPLLHLRAPEYETDERGGRATWRIERGLLVAKRGRGRGFLRLSVQRLARQSADDKAAVLMRVEVRNFYPWLRGSGRFARLGTWLYSQTQLRIHVLVCNAFLGSLPRLALLRQPLR
jgi:hypothetical protein